MADISAYVFAECRVVPEDVFLYFCILYIFVFL